MVEVRVNSINMLPLVVCIWSFHNGKLYQGQDVDHLLVNKLNPLLILHTKIIWGLNANMNFKRWNVFGEWLTAPGVSDSHAWMASLGLW